MLLPLYHFLRCLSVSPSPPLQRYASIVTGNAGDGKTAFIKSLEADVQREGGGIEQITANSSRFFHNGISFLTNYDGSQDEGAERANDKVLTEFFAPYADRHFDEPGVSPVYVIAINEGRLIDFFHHSSALPGGEESERPAFQRLSQVISDFFDPDGKTDQIPNWILIVDLNERSIVASDPDQGNTSIFDRQLMAILRPEFWSVCDDCALRDRCFIKYNADTLSDPASGPIVRERLRTLYEVVHLRRQLHLTMRDMRSALAWLLFRDHSCDDVARTLDGHNQAEQNLLNLFYHNAYAFDGQPLEGRTDDRLVRLLRQIDPAEVANPMADRLLHFRELAGLPMLAFESRSDTPSKLISDWNLPTGWEAAQAPDIIEQQRSRHKLLRRMAFYERRGDDWRMMLPYANLRLFEEATQSTGNDREQLKKLLVEGISMAEGARNIELARRFVCLRAGATKRAPIKSFRLFPIEDFKLQVPHDGGPYLEYTPDRIIFFHDPQDPSQRVPGARRAELSVTLDVLELLAQIRAGFSPSLDDIVGFFVNLIIFKNALGHLPFRQVVLTRDESQFYQLAQENGSTLVLQPWSAERI